MTRITPDLVRNLITQNGQLVVPKTITEAIGSCVVSHASDIETEGARLKAIYDSFETKQTPISVTYNGDSTVDAYSVYYLPRNTLVPKAAILCCSYHPFFQNLPSRLKVLDLGSGTGGVVLGLLDLFHTEALSGTHLDIVALDASSDSLQRQQELVDCLGLNGSTHLCICADLSNPNSYQSTLVQHAPYDMVFAANLFAELAPTAMDTLLKSLAPLLSKNGILVNVESHTNYVMNQQVRMSIAARNLNLSMYYPCPPNLSCPKSACWNWRTDEFLASDVIVRKKTLAITNIHKAHWMILSTTCCSIYDILVKKNPRLTWGIAAPYGKAPSVVQDRAEQEFEVCTSKGKRKVKATMSADKWTLSLRSSDGLLRRGSIIGFTDDFSEVETWDMLDQN